MCLYVWSPYYLVFPNKLGINYKVINKLFFIWINNTFKNFFSVTETTDNTANVKILKAIKTLFSSENSRQKEVTASGSR